MELQDQQQLFRQVIRAWGVPFQLDMVTEEFAELLKILNKAKRKGIVTMDCVLKPGEMEMGTLYHDICSEIADCKILLKQLEIIFDPEFINLSEERKLTRLQERLENHLYEQENGLNKDRYFKLPATCHPNPNAYLVVEMIINNQAPEISNKPYLASRYSSGEWKIFLHPVFSSDFCRANDSDIKKWRYLTKEEDKEWFSSRPAQLKNIKF